MKYCLFHANTDNDVLFQFYFTRAIHLSRWELRRTYAVRHWHKSVPNDWRNCSRLSCSWKTRREGDEVTRTNSVPASAELLSVKTVWFYNFSRFATKHESDGSDRNSQCSSIMCRIDSINRTVISLACWCSSIQKKIFRFTATKRVDFTIQFNMISRSVALNIQTVTTNEY